MPKEAMNRRDYRTAKFGSWERSLALDAQLTEVGRAEGIHFAFEKDRADSQYARRAPPYPAGLLGGRAGGRGGGSVPGLLHRRARPQPHADAARRAAEAGLDRGRAEEMLRGASQGAGRDPCGRRACAASGGTWRAFFVINGEMALSGAREVSAFLDAFDRTASAAGGVCHVREGRERTC